MGTGVTIKGQCSAWCSEGAVAGLLTRSWGIFVCLRTPSTQKMWEPRTLFLPPAVCSNNILHCSVISSKRARLQLRWQCGYISAAAVRLTAETGTTCLSHSTQPKCWLYWGWLLKMTESLDETKGDFSKMVNSPRSFSTLRTVPHI
jgi:hypothetical protein